MNILGNNVKFFIDDRGIKQKDIAEIMEISEPSVTLLKKGRYNPAIGKLKLLANFLDIPNYKDLLERKFFQDSSQSITNEPTVIYHTRKKENEIQIINPSDFKNIGTYYENAIGAFNHPDLKEGLAIVSPYELEDIAKDDLLVISRSPHMLTEGEVYFIKYSNRAALVKVIDMSKYPQVKLIEDKDEIYVNMTNEQLFLIDAKLSITLYE